MTCGATQDGQVMLSSSKKTRPTGEGNGKPLQYACLENPMISMKRQKDRTLKDEFPRLVGTQYATGDQWRNNSRKNGESEKAGSKLNIHKTKIMASSPITSWQTDGGKMETVTDIIFRLQNHCGW